MTQSMSHKPLDSRHSIDSCLLQLRSWKPFKLQQDGPHPKPYYHKRPCLSDRTTTSFSLDMSKLTLAADDDTIHNPNNNRATNYRLVARKRRRRGSRSLSGRSSDRSGTRRCCSVGASAAYGTCSDFPVAMGTDSSGELFGNGDPNWSSDVSEAKNSRRERERDGEKENVGVGFGVSGCSDANGNESGYGSEPGYRGDAEFGYGDEFDEEEDDPRLLFWGDQLGENDLTFIAPAVDSKREMVGENTLLDQKSHHRCRRRKHDCRMVDALR
ncbi:hypothetical protein JHK82_026666 [Glycine max]|uniref:uncharacterized protein isoform X1 n=1 Tax=Glycine max TaxID=3847 RepID=UPI0007192863|nr:uncharacterized protein LOC100798288 isoform X1 [Glycine max]KAG4981799.1 hypothetical protein JHK87_026548 [Glycine soja]KAG4396836.1 hypothetical protein GLYMA_10G018600v4 [Glycine max]KAG4995846.1 hypothetical protein JHK85_027285 [Glycine max]KAG5002647.1 hypothetical protein JHK86_026786 [Glycine max]KAG5125831.1 hypothetical protein JHK82_026666 [Glycine max]|eukprot:XP_014618376.1 uncharacterized protein LOC100798288 isoform X1 [Glycine max]